MSGKRRVALFGASGHAKVVLDACKRAGLEVSGLFDDNTALHGSRLLGYSVRGGRAEWHAERDKFTTIVAIGSNPVRARIADWVVQEGGQLAPAIVHPAAVVGSGVSIGAGTVLMAGVVVNSDAVIGLDVIINTGARVDHDCLIGDHVHIAPGATLCGGVRVGNGALIGAGAVVCPNMNIGVGAVVGAGAVVVRDVPENCVVAGVPARIMEQV